MNKMKENKNQGPGKNKKKKKKAAPQPEPEPEQVEEVEEVEEVVEEVEPEEVPVPTPTPAPSSSKTNAKGKRNAAQSTKTQSHGDAQHEANVEALINMGFTREQATDALLHVSTVDAAVDFIFNKNASETVNSPPPASTSKPGKDVLPQKDAPPASYSSAGPSKRKKKGKEKETVVEPTEEQKSGSDANTGVFWVNNLPKDFTEQDV